MKPCPKSSPSRTSSSTSLSCRSDDETAENIPCLQPRFLSACPVVSQGTTLLQLFFWSTPKLQYHPKTSTPHSERLNISHQWQKRWSYLYKWILFILFIPKTYCVYLVLLLFVLIEIPHVHASGMTQRETDILIWSVCSHVCFCVIPVVQPVCGHNTRPIQSPVFCLFILYICFVYFMY